MISIGKGFRRKSFIENLNLRSSNEKSPHGLSSKNCQANNHRIISNLFNSYQGARWLPNTTNRAAGFVIFALILVFTVYSWSKPSSNFFVLNQHLTNGFAGYWTNRQKKNEFIKKQTANFTGLNLFAFSTFILLNAFPLRLVCDHKSIYKLWTSQTHNQPRPPASKTADLFEGKGEDRTWPAELQSVADQLFLFYSQSCGSQIVRENFFRDFFERIR